MTTAIAAYARPLAAAHLFNYAGFEIRRIARNRRFLFLSIGFPLIFYVLETGVLQGKQPRNLSIDGIPWATYFMVSMASYGAMVSMLNWSRIIATERSNGWTRQLQAMPLDSRLYLATKVVTSFLTTLPCLVLVLGVGLLANRVSLSATTWIALGVALAIGSIPFAGLGLLLGYLFDGDSVQGAAMIVNFAIAILGGMWAPISSFPSGVADVARILPTYHYANIGWTILAGHAIDPVDVGVLAVYAVAFGALVIWRYLADEQKTRG